MTVASSSPVIKPIIPDARVATVPDLLRVARELGVSAGTLLRAIEERRSRDAERVSHVEEHGHR